MSHRVSQKDLSLSLFSRNFSEGASVGERTISPGVTDFWLWSRQEFPMLDAEQKDHGPWGEECCRK